MPRMSDIEAFLSSRSATRARSVRVPRAYCASFAAIARSVASCARPNARSLPNARCARRCRLLLMTQRRVRTSSLAPIFSWTVWSRAKDTAGCANTPPAPSTRESRRLRSILEWASASRRSSASRRAACGGGGLRAGGAPALMVRTFGGRGGGARAEEGDDLPICPPSDWIL